MARDHVRPAWYQVRQIGRCTSCGQEHEFSADETVDGRACYSCGGRMAQAGESYPADSREWDEERDDYHSPWRQRR